MDEHLASRLSARAAQVLLAVLLVREGEVHFDSREFAKTHSGLSWRATPQALSELELGGLSQILTQVSDSAQEVQAHQGSKADKEIVDEVYAEGSNAESLIQRYGWPDFTTHAREGGVDGLDGVSPGSNGAGVHADSSEGPGQESEEALEEGQEEAPDPLGLCRLADQSRDRRGQVKALQACWDVAFPVEEYEYQRLTDATAKHFLVNRSAEFVGGVILDAAANARTPIQWPRSYVEKALESADKKRDTKGKPVEQVSEITDELRILAELAGRQIRAKHAAQASD